MRSRRAGTFDNCERVHHGAVLADETQFACLHELSVKFLPTIALGTIKEDALMDDVAHKGGIELPTSNEDEAEKGRRVSFL